MLKKGTYEAIGLAKTLDPFDSINDIFNQYDSANQRIVNPIEQNPPATVVVVKEDT